MVFRKRRPTPTRREQAHTPPSARYIDYLDTANKHGIHPQATHPWLWSRFDQLRQRIKERTISREELEEEIKNLKGKRRIIRTFGVLKDGLFFLLQPVTAPLYHFRRRRQFLSTLQKAESLEDVWNYVEKNLRNIRVLPSESYTGYMKNKENQFRIHPDAPHIILSHEIPFQHDRPTRDQLYSPRELTNRLNRLQQLDLIHEIGASLFKQQYRRLWPIFYISYLNYMRRVNKEVSKLSKSTSPRRIKRQIRRTNRKSP